MVPVELDLEGAHCGCTRTADCTDEVKAEGGRSAERHSVCCRWRFKSLAVRLKSETQKPHRSTRGADAGRCPREPESWILDGGVVDLQIEDDPIRQDAPKVLRLWMAVVRFDGREDPVQGLRPPNPAGGSLLGLAPDDSPNFSR